MVIGDTFSSGAAGAFQGAMLTQGMTARKNKNLAAGLADAPHMPNAPAEAPPTESATPPPPLSGEPDNVMARNFVKLDYKPSKYVQASISAAQQEQSFSHKMSSLVGGLEGVAAQWSGQGQSDYLIGIRLGLLAEEKLGQVKDEETNKASAENLEDIKEDVEKKAEEATAPEDTKSTDAATAEEKTAEAEDTEAKNADSEPSTSQSVSIAPSDESLTESIANAAEAALANKENRQNTQSAMAAYGNATTHTLSTMQSLPAQPPPALHTPVNILV